MQHYVFIKFKPGYLSEDRVKEIRNVYADIVISLQGVIEIQIEQNCIKRNSNMDLMIRMTLSDKSQLSTYLDYPAHRKMASDMEPYIQNRFTFDC